jgi:hypothetical protein
MDDRACRSLHKLSREAGNENRDGNQNRITAHILARIVFDFSNQIPLLCQFSSSSEICSKRNIYSTNAFSFLFFSPASNPAYISLLRVGTI